MSRAAVILLMSAVVGVGFTRGASAQAQHPHLDPATLLLGCSSCHRGHGVSGSPMLPQTQSRLCLGCHGSRGDLARRIAAGELRATAVPTSLDSSLSQPFVHPMTGESYSRRDPAAVTCTSCHSPHRGSAETSPGSRKLAPGSADLFEFELCLGCHASDSGTATRAGSFVGRSLTHPSHRSYHPVESPTLDRSSSVRADLTGREISCTDCHGNSDPDGARGPHGSAVRGLLLEEYVAVDGSSEAAQTYALCYSCHDREKVLGAESTFPLHYEHVVTQRASCATCHDPHAAVGNRALIRFGDEQNHPSVAPSAADGRLAFESFAPGAGSCSLTCHGYDHPASSYGLNRTVDGHNRFSADAVRRTPFATPSMNPTEKPQERGREKGPKKGTSR